MWMLTKREAYATKAKIKNTYIPFYLHEDRSLQTVWRRRQQ